MGDQTDQIKHCINLIILTLPKPSKTLNSKWNWKFPWMWFYNILVIWTRYQQRQLVSDITRNKVICFTNIWSFDSNFSFFVGVCLSRHCFEALQADGGSISQENCNSEKKIAMRRLEVQSLVKCNWLRCNWLRCSHWLKVQLVHFTFQPPVLWFGETWRDNKNSFIFIGRQTLHFLYTIQH